MNKMTVALVAIVLIVGGFLLFNSSESTDESDNAANTNTNQQTNDTEEPAPAEDGDFGSMQTVMYNDVGFSPEMLTSKAGEKVTIENKSGSTIEVYSAPHPSHEENPELNIGAIEAGQSKTFTLTTKGDFSFHNHLKPDEVVRIVVQ